jgi:cytochrome c biogenesis protein CcdA
MGLSETLGQVMQTCPVLAYGASYLGGVTATASPCILASIPRVIAFVGGYAGGSKGQALQSRGAKAGAFYHRRPAASSSWLGPRYSCRG